MSRFHGVIYLGTNNVNGKQYVGQTIRVDPKLRIRRHFADARGGKNSPLCNAIRKHGISAFDFVVICHCDDQASLDAAEAAFIRLFDTFVPNGYNLKDGGARGKASEETKQKQSQSIRGAYQRPEVKERHRKAISDPANVERQKAATREAMQRPEVQINILARNADPEYKRNQADSIRKAYERPESRRRASVARTATMARPEVQAKLAALRSDPEFQERHAAAIRAALARPEVKSKQIEGIRKAQAEPAYRKKLSESSTKRWADPSQRAHMSETLQELKWWHTPEGIVYRAIERRSDEDRPGRKDKPVKLPIAGSSWYTTPDGVTYRAHAPRDPDDHLGRDNWRPSQETLDGARKTNTGRKMPREGVERGAAKRRGQPRKSWSREAIERNSLKRIGQKRTPEQREKMRVAALQREGRKRAALDEATD